MKLGNTISHPFMLATHSPRMATSIFFKIYVQEFGEVEEEYKCLEAVNSLLIYLSTVKDIPYRIH